MCRLSTVLCSMVATVAMNPVRSPARPRWPCSTSPVSDTLSGPEPPEVKAFTASSRNRPFTVFTRAWSTATWDRTMASASASFSACCWAEAYC